MEIAVKTFCYGLDVLDILTGKASLLCAVTGHKWGTRGVEHGSGVGIGHYWCERCGHTETVDNTENYLNAVSEAHRQSGMPEPV